MAYPDPKPLPGFVTIFAYGVGLFIFAVIAWAVVNVVWVFIQAIIAALN